ILALHVPLLQKPETPQSGSTTHDEAQTPTTHTNGAQSVTPLALHMPAPSHVLASVCTSPLHDAGTHTVPLIHLRHAPAPSHVPSSPQLDCGDAAHSSSGSVPAAIGPH